MRLFPFFLFIFVLHTCVTETNAHGEGLHHDASLHEWQKASSKKQRHFIKTTLDNFYRQQKLSPDSKIQEDNLETMLRCMERKRKKAGSKIREEKLLKALFDCLDELNFSGKP